VIGEGHAAEHVADPVKLKKIYFIHFCAPRWRQEVILEKKGIIQSKETVTIFG
jgi:hypothetical protein